MTEPTTVELTAPEEQLLALIREGLYDAEIAVRLGITNRDVKERIERIVAKLGVRDRAELRRAAPRPAEPGPPGEERPFADRLVVPRGPLYPALFAAALVAIGAFIVLAFLWPSDDAAEGASVVVEPALTAVPSPTIATVHIAGRDMIEAGALFTADSPGTVLRSSAREDLLAVELTGVAYVDARAWQVVYSSTSEFGLRRTVAGRAVFLQFEAAPRTVFGRGGGNGGSVFAVTTIDYQPPAFVVWGGEDFRISDLHLELDDEHVLYVSADPTPGDSVIVFATGEALDVSHATALGKAPVVPQSSAVNQCSAQPANCQAFVYADGPPANPVTFLVPVDGTLTCRDDGVLQLEAASFRLFFQQVDRTGKDLFGCYPPSSAASDPKGRAREVHAGEVLSQSTHYRITAETLAGATLSVVVGGDRTIYVGVITPRFGCPCRTGN